MTTLANLTRQAARLVTRTVIGSATALGTTTTLVDTNNLANFPDDQFNGGAIWITSGVNAGLSRAITDFATLTKQVTFAAFPQAIAAGVTYEIVDAHLFTYQDLKQAVNLALREIGMILDVDETTTITSKPIFDLPTGVSNVVGIEFVTGLGTANETSSKSLHWEERFDQLIFETNPSGEILRILYERFHTELTGDTDALDSSVDEKCLVYFSARQALRLAYKRLGKQKEELPEWLNEAITEMEKHKSRNRKPLVRINPA